MSFEAIKHALAHPALRGLSLDDPRTTELRRDVIRGNGFLKRIYDEWYSILSSRIPPGRGAVLELGSGGGFFDDFVRDAVLSEIFVCQGMSAVLDGCQMPFESASLRAITMVDVFHHVPEIRPFLSESARCLRPGGALLMIEPWSSRWSRMIFTHFHHEPFDPTAPEWRCPTGGPLSGANGALPWIVFERDRAILARDFPEFEIREIRPMMPLRYLTSGGVSMRQLMPTALFAPFRQIDNWLSKWPATWPMFALIDVRRK